MVACWYQHLTPACARARIAAVGAGISDYVRIDEKAPSFDATYVPRSQLAGLSVCRMNAPSLGLDCSPSAAAIPLSSPSLSPSPAFQRASTHFISLIRHRPAPRMVEAKGCDGRGRGGNTWCLRRTRDYDPQFQGNIGIEIKYYLPDPQ